MGNFLIGLGVAALIALGVAYLFFHPEVLTGLREAIEKARVGSKSQQATPPVTPVRTGYRAGSLKFTERMGTLPANTQLTVRDPQTARVVELQSITTLTFTCRTQFRGDKSPWEPSGEVWTGILAVANPDWSRTQVLLLNLGHEAYLFQKRVPIGPEEARRFIPAANKFRNGPKGKQARGSENIIWDAREWAIQDIGVFDVVGQIEQAHISPGALVRWMLALRSDNSAILIEDAAKGSGDTDGVWEGWLVDLDRVVTEVLTPDGG